MLSMLECQLVVCQTTITLLLKTETFCRGLCLQTFMFCLHFYAFCTIHSFSIVCYRFAYFFGAFLNIANKFVALYIWNCILVSKREKKIFQLLVLFRWSRPMSNSHLSKSKTLRKKRIFSFKWIWIKIMLLKNAMNFNGIQRQWQKEPNQNMSESRRNNKKKIVFFYTFFSLSFIYSFN